MQSEQQTSAPEAAADWPDQIYGLLKEHGIRQVALVPDAGHSRLIKRCLADNDIKVVTLTTEEEGIGMLFGAWLGGEKGVLLMQSSGVGNCINMLSVAIAYFINWNGHGLALHWAFLIVFGFYLLIAGLLVLLGIKRVKKVKAPEAAIRQGKEIPSALKGKA